MKRSSFRIRRPVEDEVIRRESERCAGDESLRSLNKLLPPSKDAVDDESRARRLLLAMGIRV